MISLRFFLFLVPSVVLVSCQKEAAVEQAVDPALREGETMVALRDEIAVLQASLVEEQGKRRRQENEQRAVLQELKKMVQSLRQEKKDEEVLSRLASQDVEFKVGVPAVREERSDQSLEAARTAARQEARGETYENLRTRSGKQYHDLMISRITDLGVVFRHRTGVARVSFPDLPDGWSDRFFYDPELTARAEKAEQLTQMRQAEAVERQLQKQREEKAQVDAGARLAQLARAVEDLRREGEENRVVLQNTFSRTPLVFAPNQPGGYWWNNLFSAPVFCPPVIRTDHTQVPVIRNQTRRQSAILRVPQLGDTTPLLRRQATIQRVQSPTVVPPSTRSGSSSTAIRQSRPVIPASPTPKVIRPSSRSTGGATAVSRPRTRQPRTVRPSSPSRATPSRKVIRKPR